MERQIGAPPLVEEVAVGCGAVDFDHTGVGEGGVMGRMCIK